MTRKVVVVVFDGVNDVDVSGPSSVFAYANRLHRNAYEVVHASASGGSVTTEGGLVLSSLTALDSIAAPIDTVIITGGSETALLAAVGEGIIGPWLLNVAPKARRLGSVCTGAFLLAATGLMDGKRMATHWAGCEQLERFFPAISVAPDAIFIMDDHTFSSAGVSASIDLTLALVEADHGHEVAASIARSMVLYLRRPGGQAQFSQFLAHQSALEGPFQSLLSWVSENPDKDLSVAELARRAMMSERSFSRAFVKETGKTPASFVRTVRLETALRLIETTSRSVKQIAHDAGFGSTDSLERAIVKFTGFTATQLRQRFGKNKIN